MISSRVSAIRALNAGFSRPIYNVKKIYKQNKQVNTNVSVRLRKPEPVPLD